MALKLQGELSLDGSGWQRGLNQAGAQARSFVSGTINSLGGQIAAAFSVGAITALTKKTIEYAGHINDLSDRLGVSTDYLQEMQYVTKQNGASVEELTATFEKLGVARMKALSGEAGSEKTQQQFAKLGVGVNDLQTMGTQGLMDKIAATFKQLGNNDEIKSAFKELGGKGAGVLVPSFIDGIEQGRQAARDAGVVIGEDILVQLDQIGDQFDQLSIRLMTNIAPSIIEFADALGYLADKIGQSQSVVGEVLGNVAGAASPTELMAANERAQKYAEQINRRVASGEISKEEGQKRLQQTLGNADISGFDPLAGVSQAYSDTVKQQENSASAAAAARAAKIAERKKVQEGGTYAKMPEEIKSRKVGIPSDSLTSVGNFLGSGGNAITNIAQKQLDVARNQLAATKETNSKLDRIISDKPKAVGFPLH